MQPLVFAAASLVAVLASLAFSASAGDDAYRDEIEHWRQKRLESLKADDGWLTVSGFFWLKPGETKIGSDPSNDILLPTRTPGSLGTLTLAEGKATFQPGNGVKITRNGSPFEGGEIQSDAGGQADTLAVGDVKLLLLKRGNRLALRIKDNQSPLRSSFAGLRWYPAHADWRIEAKFVAYPTPKKMVMDTIVGESDVVESPGYVTFEREGKTYQLQAIGQKDGSLWFVFRDKTSGRTTHGGAAAARCGRSQRRRAWSFSTSTRRPISHVRTSRTRPVRSRLRKTGSVWRSRPASSSMRRGSSMDRQVRGGSRLVESMED